MCTPIVQNVAIISFHHKRGVTLDKIFPESETYPFNKSDLPDFSLPDRAHNFDSDSFSFLLPSSEDPNKVFFCLSIYRQVKATDFKLLSDEDTRNTIQKSFLVILRFPLSNFIKKKISVIFDNILKSASVKEFNDGFEKSYSSLNRQIDEIMKSPELFNQALYLDTNVLDLVLTYQRDVLVLIKAILLERRILFDGESAGMVTGWINSFMSLFPDLFKCGYQSNTYDQEWMNDRLCWPFVNRPLKTPVSKVDQKQTQVDYEDPNKLDQAVEAIEIPGTVLSSDNEPSGNQTNFVKGSLSSSSLNDPARKNTPTTPSSLDDLIQSLNGEGCVVKERDTCNPFLTDKLGLPLALFTKRYKILPYIPLTKISDLIDTEELMIDQTEHLIKSTETRTEEEEKKTDEEVEDVTTRVIKETWISDRRLRGFIAGATNPLFVQKKEIFDIIVTSAKSAFKSALDKEVMDVLAESQLNKPDPELSKTQQTSSPINFLLRRPQLVEILDNSSKYGPFYVETMERRDDEDRLITVKNTFHNCRQTQRPLSKVLDLSKMDRIFIDHLIFVCNTWMKINLTRRISASVANATSQIVDPVEEDVNNRFPNLEALESWIRDNFKDYILSLLLTTNGFEASTPSDFNTLYLSAFQETRCFQIWRKNLTDDVRNLKIQEKPTARQVWEHPGREYQKHLMSYQVLENIKQFGTSAADQSREFMRRGLSNILKLSNEAQKSQFVGDLSSNFLRSVKAVKLLAVGEEDHLKKANLSNRPPTATSPSDSPPSSS